MWRIETWEHVVTCRTLSDQNACFVKEVQCELNKQTKTDEYKSAVSKIINDLKKFILNLDTTCETNQRHIG